MSFATRVDLLARSNVKRLAALAVPTDVEMPPVESLRTAINASDLTGYSDVIVLMMDKIDKALADADALILGYGIPATVQNSLLARIGSTIAFYYLNGEKISEEVKRSYDGVIDLLKSHVKGTIDLINKPVAPVPPETDSGVVITSRPSRYGGSRCEHTIDWIDHDFT